MNSGKNKITVFMILVIILLNGLVLSYKYLEKDKEIIDNGETKKVSLPNKMLGNELESFDLYFLKLENGKKNMLYSPLSIKYTLEMLNDAANGNSKNQIESVVGEYKPKKYNNNSNMSFANGLFVRNTYKNSIKQEYINSLKEKYNAEVIYDDFKTTSNINNWVSNKTFKLINNIVDDVSDNDFLLINALSIDMEWKYLIQPMSTSENVSNYPGTRMGWTAYYPHENYRAYVSKIGDNEIQYPTLSFNNNSIDAKSVDIGASANKYDIVTILKEENIRKTVAEAYKEFVKNKTCGEGPYEDEKTVLDRYIKEIKTGYKQISSSTDFEFYVDDEVKVFEKELKEYNGTTLEYIGIMPTNQTLDKYIETITVEKLNKIINSLKKIELDSFEEGVITRIKGRLPLFKFDYELNLMDDLKNLGIVDVFDKEKSNLTNITKEKAYINKTIHKSNIEFSNQGIKASAATLAGGAGAAGCSFEYKYEVPVKEIDLTFDKPYIFLIRDKNTHEVWFIGSVYEPIKNK